MTHCNVISEHKFDNTPSLDREIASQTRCRCEWSSQRSLLPSLSTLNRWDYIPDVTFYHYLPHFQPGVSRTLLYNGSRFTGHQKSKGNQYDVEVMLQVTSSDKRFCFADKIFILERWWGERIHLRIFKNQEPDGRVSRDGDILWRRNNHWQTSIPHEKMGRRRRCWQKTLGDMIC